MEVIFFSKVVSQISTATWWGTGSTGRSCAMVLASIVAKGTSVLARAAWSRSHCRFSPAAATYQSARMAATTVSTGNEARSLFIAPPPQS